MAGRQGQNKGSKGKPGFQPVVGKGKTIPQPAKTLKDSKATAARTKNATIIPTLCYDPNICHVKTHRNTVCKAYEYANKDILVPDKNGLIRGENPKVFTERMLTNINQYNDGLDYEIDYSDEVIYNSAGKTYWMIDSVSAQVKDSYRFVSDLLENGNEVYTGIKDSYSLSKILERNDIYSIDMFAYDIIDDYYEQSLANFYVDKKTKDGMKVFSSVEKFFTLSSDDRIRYALEAEYGYVLPQLEEATFSVEKLSPRDVILPDTDTRDSERYNTLIQEENNPHTGFQYSQAVVKGIVIPLGNGKYKLIDGRHRHVHANHDERGIYIVAHTSY